MRDRDKETQRRPNKTKDKLTQLKRFVILNYRVIANGVHSRNFSF